MGASTSPLLLPEGQRKWTSGATFRSSLVSSVQSLPDYFAAQRGWGLPPTSALLHIARPGF